MKIGRILGIDIFVNVSWLFIFGLVAWSLASNVGPLHAVAMSPLARASLALITAGLFFASVLFHELSHSLVARKRGVPVRGITLFIFGGVSLLEAEAPSAPAEAWISGIGPLMSLALGLLFSCIAVLLDGGNHASAVHDWRPAFGVAFGYLAAANVTLAIFNILPAYPLDGGRVLHAIVWRVTRSRSTATRIAVIFGRIISAALIVLGILWTVTDGLGGGLWITLIGWFLLQAGESERVAARVGDALRGHHAAEFARPPAVRIPADQTAENSLQALLTHHVHSAPVFIGERFIGVVTLQSLVRVADPARTYVTAVMTPLQSLHTISAASEAGEVTRLLSRGGHPLLPVVEESGEVLGFITRESMLTWMTEPHDFDATPS